MIYVIDDGVPYESRVIGVLQGPEGVDMVELEKSFEAYFEQFCDEDCRWGVGLYKDPATYDYKPVYKRMARDLQATELKTWKDRDTGKRRQRLDYPEPQVLFMYWLVAHHGFEWVQTTFWSLEI